MIENSRAAFEAAIAAGYGIEMDIQRSADGEAMVFHDYEMLRLTDEPGLIHDYTAAQLGRIALLGADEPVPTLARVLELVAGRTALLIEIKDQDGALGPDVGPLEARVAALLADYPGEVALMSFNPHSVAALAEAAPDRPRGLTTCAFEDADWSLPDYRRAELAALARRRAHRRRLRLARPPRPRQPGARPPQGRGLGRPDLDRPQPGRGGRGPPRRRQHHLRGLPPRDPRSVADAGARSASRDRAMPMAPAAAFSRRS